MGALNRFEQRLEHMVTGAFARAFRSAVQPMEIAAALQREVDNSAQILSRNRRIAPNNFQIDLSGADFDRLSTYGEALSRELAAMLHEHATEQHYLFAGPVRLNFTRADDLTTGRFRVRSEASAAVTPAAGQSLSDTAISRAPIFLEINGVRHPLTPPGLVIGRGTNADLRVNDAGVSRRHVEFRVQQGPGGPRISLFDLGSTNGTTVNGHRVQNSPLGDGAVVQIGATRIIVSCPPPASGPPAVPEPQSRSAPQSAQRAQSPGAPWPQAGPRPSPDGQPQAVQQPPPPRSSSRWGRPKKRQPPPFKTVHQPQPNDPHQRPGRG
ncbi:MAG: DUF3662 domain-containing protein [Nocardioidaceae bacterium]|nr:DUF3662 domain-containing protein [Nocardioidaceae bacterium]